jgi:hypothetical protein
MQKKTKTYLGAFAAACLAGASHATILFIGSYSQDFNTLPTSASNVAGAAGGIPAWTNDTTLDGWYAGSSSTWVDGMVISNGGLSSMLSANGTNGTGSFGTSSATDRALAPVRRNGGTSYVALRLTNDTGATLTEITLAYTGEQWRSNNVAGSLVFAYSVDQSATINTGTYTAFNSLDFAAPQGVGSATSTALDGNALANRTAISSTITGLSLADGDDIWLRWAFSSNNAVNLAIDDLTVTAVPEPGTLALLGIALGSMLLFRRKRG